MGLNEVLELVSRWLHILPAIVLVGGILFMRFALVGPCREFGASENLREAIRKKWAPLVMISILLLANVTRSPNKSSVSETARSFSSSLFMTSVNLRRENTKLNLDLFVRL